MTTGLDPAMTLGCGGWGGNITSDNISPKHLLNVKRLAYELSPAVATTALSSSAPAVPRPTAAPSIRAGLNPGALGERIDQFLAGRGLASPGAPSTGNEPAKPGGPAEFVCEEDVRQAVQAGRKIVLGSRSIVTPAARDLGEEKRVFVESR